MTHSSIMALSLILTVLPPSVTHQPRRLEQGLMGALLMEEKVIVIRKMLVCMYGTVNGKWIVLA